jgi:hypothetical protein
MFSHLPPMSSSETWVHYFTLRRNPKTIKSAGKVLMAAFWDAHK